MSDKHSHRGALWEEEVALPTKEIGGVGWDGPAVNYGPEQHLQPHPQLLLAFCHACQEAGCQSAFTKLQCSQVIVLKAMTRCIKLWRQIEN